MTNRAALSTALIVMSLALGCVTPHARMSRNNSNLLSLEMGMTKQQVMDIMGSPDLNEAYRSLYGKNVVILFYYTQRQWADGNTTKDEWRLAVHTGFCKGWLRTEENHQLSVPLEIAKTLPERAQYLLGFRSYSPPSGARLGLVNYDDASLLLD